MKKPVGQLAEEQFQALLKKKDQELDEEERRQSERKEKIANLKSKRLANKA